MSCDVVFTTRMPGRRTGTWELEHFQITAKLGQGGMGEVYLAEDSKLKRRVALKVLPEEMSSDRERLERFQREAEAVAALNHPNIVHIYSIESAGDLNFLTMELVEGKTLGELTPGGGLAVDRFFEVAVPLADALAAAHAKGITHRDLKPANIMVTDEGRRVKILDFGLAKLQQGGEGVAVGTELPTQGMTREGAVLGTIPYMSPEQLGGEAVDNRTARWPPGRGHLRATTMPGSHRRSSPARQSR